MDYRIGDGGMNKLQQLICGHDYELVHEKETYSEFEQVYNVGRTPNTHCSLSKKYIQTFKCSKCGRVKQKVFNI